MKPHHSDRLRKRELIEHRIDLKYQSQEGLNHHRNDYYKRMLKKIEENYERTRIRNKQLVTKAEEVLNDITMSASSNLVRSQVKLDVAKVCTGFSWFEPPQKQFMDEFKVRIQEFEAMSRQERLRQIKKTEDEIEDEKKRSRNSQLEWEREKKVNQDLQEKIKELIVTKEQAKKEAIEREAERKALLEGGKLNQR